MLHKKLLEDSKAIVQIFCENLLTLLYNKTIYNKIYAICRFARNAMRGLIFFVIVKYKKLKGTVFFPFFKEHVQLTTCILPEH